MNNGTMASIVELTINLIINNLLLVLFVYGSVAYLIIAIFDATEPYPDSGDHLFVFVFGIFWGLWIVVGIVYLVSKVWMNLAKALWGRMKEIE